MRVSNVVTAVLLVGLTAGCASSKNQTRTEEPEATGSTEPPDQSSEQPADEAADTAEPETRPVVELEQLIGRAIADGMPEGCPTEWNELEGRNFDGTLYACDGFRAPRRYEEATVTIGIREGTVRRVHLQSFHEAGEPIARMFDRVTDDYQSRCDREGGAGPRMMLDCGDYLVDIRMQREGGLLNIVYGLENWDLPY